MSSMNPLGELDNIRDKIFKEVAGKHPDPNRPWVESFRELYGMVSFVETVIKISEKMKETRSLVTQQTLRKELEMAQSKFDEAVKRLFKWVELLKKQAGTPERREQVNTMNVALKEIPQELQRLLTEALKESGVVAKASATPIVAQKPDQTPKVAARAPKKVLNPPITQETQAPQADKTNYYNMHRVTSEDLAKFAKIKQTTAGKTEPTPAQNKGKDQLASNVTQTKPVSKTPSQPAVAKPAAQGAEKPKTAADKSAAVQAAAKVVTAQPATKTVAKATPIVAQKPEKPKVDPKKVLAQQKPHKPVANVVAQPTYDPALTYNLKPDDLALINQINRQQPAGPNKNVVQPIPTPSASTPAKPISKTPTQPSAAQGAEKPKTGDKPPVQTAAKVETAQSAAKTVAKATPIVAQKPEKPKVDPKKMLAQQKPKPVANDVAQPTYDPSKRQSLNLDKIALFNQISKMSRHQPAGSNKNVVQPIPTPSASTQANPISQAPANPAKVADQPAVQTSAAERAPKPEMIPHTNIPIPQGGSFYEPNLNANKITKKDIEKAKELIKQEGAANKPKSQIPEPAATQANIVQPQSTKAVQPAATSTAKAESPIVQSPAKPIPIANAAESSSPKLREPAKPFLPLQEGQEGRIQRLKKQLKIEEKLAQQQKFTQTTRTTVPPTPKPKT